MYKSLTVNLRSPPIAIPRACRPASLRCRLINHLSTIDLRYATWIGYINEEQKGRINAVIKKLIRFQYLPPDQPLIEELSQKSDLRLFKSVISNPNHILNKFLPPIKTTKYSMRSRPHNRQLPMDDSFERRGFINRLLFVV